MKNWSEYLDIQGNMYYYEGLVGWANGFINTNGPRLEELQGAAAGLDGCLDRLVEGRNALRKLPTRAHNWTGNNAEKHYYSCEEGDLYIMYSDCIGSLECLIGGLQNDISNLRSQISYAYDVLGKNSSNADYYRRLYAHYWEE